MVDVLGVTFKNNKIIYCSTANFDIKSNITVIVKTERGLLFGKVVGEPKEIRTEDFSKNNYQILRVATRRDYLQHQKNIEDSKKAFEKCQGIIRKLGLEMALIDAEYNFDREQLLFLFVARKRVDFRELVKILASIYKTRIELRQIGIRDKAKEIGGIGKCGRELCCALYLDNLENITINMAKNQNLSLNPDNINGLCGRLLCCLKYEDEDYQSSRAQLPNIGEEKETSLGVGEVVSVNALLGTYEVKVKNKGIIEVKI